MTHNIMIEHLSHHKLLLGTSYVAFFSTRREENLAISDLRGEHTPKLHMMNDLAIRYNDIDYILHFLLLDAMI